MNIVEDGAELLSKFEQNCEGAPAFVVFGAAVQLAMKAAESMARVDATEVQSLVSEVARFMTTEIANIVARGGVENATH
jgi:hypothetical protein